MPNNDDDDVILSIAHLAQLGNGLLFYWDSFCHIGPLGDRAAIHKMSNIDSKHGWRILHNVGLCTFFLFFFLLLLPRDAV